MELKQILTKSPIFLLTLSLGIFAVGLLSSDDSAPHQCPRFDIDNSRQFFTLEEGLEIKGQKIKYAKPAAFPDNAGRIAGLDFIEQDKFFIIVDWDATPEDGSQGLRWYDKDFYYEYLVPVE